MAKTKLDLIREHQKKEHEANLFKARMNGKTKTEVIQQLNAEAKEKLFINAIPTNEFFNISGVYYLFKDKEVVYIGESSCVFRRISEHLGKKNFNHFKYIVVDGEYERKKLEKALIKNHNPIYNYTYNSNLF